MGKHDVKAISFISTLLVNVDNEKLSDSDFRDFVRNTLSIVEKPEHSEIVNIEGAKRAAKYYPVEEINVQERVEQLKLKLNDYFKKTYVKEYYVSDIDGNRITLNSNMFDEDYYDDKMDSDIAAIGLQFKLQVKWSSDVYGK